MFYLWIKDLIIESKRVLYVDSGQAILTCCHVNEYTKTVRNLALGCFKRRGFNPIGTPGTSKDYFYGFSR